MKKIIMYVMTLLIAVVIGGCTKEGPAGKDGRDGINGKDGSTIITGSGVPDASLGNVGDYYFDRTTSNLYGAKTTNGWGMPVNLKGLQGDKGDKGDTGATGSTGANGIDGNRILYGTTAPTAHLGNIGDWYIDTKNAKLYGAKTEQGWGSGISLSGGNSEGISASDYKLSADGKTLVLWMNISTRNIDMNADPNLSQVTTIGREAFVDCNNLNSIIISNSVKVIKPKAFTNLRRLSSVELGRGVQNIASINKEYNFYEHDTIKSGVFHNCTSLKTITIPKQLKDISGAFRNCTDLTSVILEEGVTDIEGAFVGCSKLSSITIPNSIVNIEGAFVKCKELKTAIIGNGVEYWKQAFQDCKNLKDVTLSDGITNIGNDGGYDGIFEGCESLSTINIPNGVTRIADRTFDGSGLVSVVLPNSVTELGKGTFANCEKLTSVTLSNQMTIIKGAEYYYDQNATFYNCKALTTLTIPANITTIEKGAFWENGLTSVTLEATTPPQIENYIGLFVDQNDENNHNSSPKLTKVKTIYVPASSLSAYQNAKGWKDLATNGISLLPKP
ncbi:leucine-rich repeat domain-containing protein [Capnocytophaga sp. H2931]|uniref:leucine-rich repeat domain-containing protein n=1 Tax=Capnocytophaga sp. H2931 TaxID=1945657 RepID=UPI000BB1AFCD|nr:leucine-rich repeat domain-containing protein [Capnocytophaga sp. H2931]ATA74026.1 hypothetical protein CGC52_00350 [Capnocytophaga sp. H2931]